MSDFYIWQDENWERLEAAYTLDDEFSLLTFDEYCLREYKKALREQG